MAALNMCFRATRLNKPVCALIKDMSGFKYDFVCSATLRTLRAQQIFGRGVSSLSKGGAVFEVCPRSSHLRAVKHRHVNIENHHRRHVCGISVFCTNVRHYSAESSQGTRLTEEILKSRTAPNEQDQEKNQNKSDESGEKKKESWFSGKNAWKLGLLSLAGMGFVMIGNLLFMWGAPALDAEGNEIVDEFTILPTWQAYPKRAWKEFHFFKRMIQEPSSEKLLPDPLKEPYIQPPYTLVLEMTDVLVHPDWTLNTGWRFKKRPGVDYFLQQVAPPLFEVVIYTKEQGFTAFPIINGLDPNGFISYRLFRDATLYRNGTHVKDLGCLNRELSKVIVIDCDPKGFELHPRNGIHLRAWKGNDEDRTLVDLATFLRTIGSSGVEDIRTVLDHYNQYDDPLEAFKEKQRQLQEQQEELSKLKAQEKQKSLAGSWSFGLTGRRK